MKADFSLKDFKKLFPRDFSEDQIAKAQTLFFKKLAESAHKFYGGKMQTISKAGVYGLNWFNVWYTPGVSKISTSIRDDNNASFDLSNRGNLVAVVSDSTRVLGDGDCTPPGGLGVMEGKAFLMKYLGGVDAVAICMDSRNSKGENDPDVIIDFVKRLQPSFGAVNLEDISQPNCYKVLDTLREECDIPVWHDDAQGTGCVTVAGLINALKVAEKDIDKVSIVMLGAGASNTSIARLIIKAGADPERMTIFDSKGSLNIKREDIKSDPRFYRKWELCQSTNKMNHASVEEAIAGADVLIALSRPGPDVVKPEWIKKMNDKAIVFACANPVPEIYPYAAHEAGAFIVATGRGDFPNQVNNSLGFPGILKGALLVRAKKITDEMTLAAATSLAKFAEKNGARPLGPDYIISTMEESDVFPFEAADVAMQAIEDGVARITMTKEEAYQKAKEEILHARSMTDTLMRNDLIKSPPEELIKEAVDFAIKSV